MKFGVIDFFGNDVKHLEVESRHEANDFDEIGPGVPAVAFGALQAVGDAMRIFLRNFFQQLRRRRLIREQGRIGGLGAIFAQFAGDTLRAAIKRVTVTFHCKLQKLIVLLINSAKKEKIGCVKFRFS